MIELIAVFLVAVVVFIWKWLRRGSSGQTTEEEPQERTIDGKVVPEKLAVSALGVPGQSPDGQYVLRGLPDYGKVLLRLDGAAFEYQPEVTEKPYEPSPAGVSATSSPAQAPFRPEKPPSSLPSFSSEKSPENSTWALWRLPALVLGVVLIIVIAVVALSRGSSHSYASYQESAPPIAAGTTPAPDPVQAAAPVPKAPAPSRNTPSDDFDKAVNSFIADKPSTASGAGKGQDSSQDWQDPATNLVWTRTDNGSAPIKSWEDAKVYCQLKNIGLESNAVRNWRLPTIEELEFLRDKSGYGDIVFSLPDESIYSSTITEDGVHHFSLNVGSIPPDVDIHQYTHALCVHN